MMSRLLLKRDSSELGETSAGRLAKYVRESDCPLCHGKRLNGAALSCKIAGYDISEMCEMELTELKRVLGTVTDPRGRSVAESLVMTLTRMIEIGLPYLSLNREAATLSGGEAQRLKLVRYMGSALTGMLYIFDEPSTGMHPRDVHRMTRLLRALRDKGNTVLVVEHDKDVISIADEVIDVGPLAGKNGGEVLYQGSYQGLLGSGTLTGKAMEMEIPFKAEPRKPQGFLPVKHASLHNLKQVSVDIPLRVLTAVTGVAGSGKSSLIRDVFAGQYPEQVILVDQSPVTATGRSTPATFLGFFDDIRKQMAKENNVSAALFSFNSKGACPVCKGRGGCHHRAGLHGPGDDHLRGLRREPLQQRGAFLFIQREKYCGDSGYERRGGRRLLFRPSENLQGAARHGGGGASLPFPWTALIHSVRGRAAAGKAGKIPGTEGEHLCAG